MKDIKGFCKLFDINIPEYLEFDYYINQLSKTYRWRNIKDLIKLYEEAESEIDDLYQFRIDKSNELIEFIKSTRAFIDLNDDNLIPDYPTTKNFLYEEDKKYLSVDIKMANWFIIKKYDPYFINELGDTYEDLLSKFGFPEVFNHSKSLRQYIFGNLNPKRQIKAQRVVIEELIKKYKYLNLEIACVKNDEVIWIIDCDRKLANILSTIDQNIFKTKIFTVERANDFRINSYWDHENKFLYKEMVGCSGNLFYLNLKKLILNEDIDIRDLYFRIEGNLAIWNHKGLKLELTI